MTFEIKNAKSKKFDNLDELLKFTDQEEESIFRLPLKPFLDQGAGFIEDKGIGKPNSFYSFNQFSFENLCNLAGIPPLTLRNIQQAGLASDVLNDLFKHGRINKNLDTLEIICDESNRQVIGFVSESYMVYSNKQFLEDLLKGLEVENTQKNLFPSLKEFEFNEAYSVNSRLYFRVTSQKVAGVVKGKGGRGDDISKIGLEVSNTMAGGHALKIAYFVHRLICANGLALPAATDQSRIIHSGSKDKFEERLQKNIQGVIDSMNGTRKTLNLLGDIQFDSDALAKHADKKEIFQLIPDYDLETACEQKIARIGRDYSDIKDKDLRSLAKLSEMIMVIPMQIGRYHSLAVFNSHFRDNASMWDFINIFTEYAKELPLPQRLETEKRAGQMADWIAKNKKKLSS